MHRSLTFIVLGIAAYGLLSHQPASAQSQPRPFQPWKSVPHNPVASTQSPPACVPVGYQVTTRYAPVPARLNPYCQCGPNGKCICTLEQCALGLCPPGCPCCANGVCCPACKRGNCVCRQCPPGCQCPACARMRRQQPQTVSLRPARPTVFGEQQAAVTRSTMRPIFPQ